MKVVLSAQCCKSAQGSMHTAGGHSLAWTTNLPELRGDGCATAGGSHCCPVPENMNTLLINSLPSFSLARAPLSWCLCSRAPAALQPPAGNTNTPLSSLIYSPLPPSCSQERLQRCRPPTENTLFYPKDWLGDERLRKALAALMERTWFQVCQNLVWTECGKWV